MVRGSHGATWIVIVGRPALLDGLGDEQDHQVDKEHQTEGQRHVVREQKQEGAPDGDGVVVPEVRGHEDISPFAEPKNNLEEQSNADEHHTEISGVTNGSHRLPTDVKSRLRKARRIDHASNERRQDTTECSGNKGHAHEAHAHEHSRLKRTLAGCLENAANNVDDDRHGNIVAKRIENLLQCCEETIH